MTLYTEAEFEVMRVRIYTVHLSLDGGKTWQEYTSAGDCIKKTGLNFRAGIRKRMVYEAGGISIKLGETTKVFTRELEDISTGQKESVLIKLTRSR